MAVSVIAENVPAPGDVPPIDPGMAKVAPPSVLALIVPDPLNVSEAPDPTTNAELVLVPPTKVAHVAPLPPLGVAQVPSPRQNVLDEAPTPPARFPTGRFPVTSEPSRTVQTLFAQFMVLFVGVCVSASVKKIFAGTPSNELAGDVVEPGTYGITAEPDSDEEMVGQP